MTTTREAGLKGAQARHAKSPEEESAIARKAAHTRKEQDPEAFQKMGRKGAEARHAKSPEEESAIAKKAAQTRKEHDPDAFSEMGRKGGQARGGGAAIREKRHEEE
jgi:general stress protein YciG